MRQWRDCPDYDPHMRMVSSRSHDRVGPTTGFERSET